MCVGRLAQGSWACPRDINRPGKMRSMPATAVTTPGLSSGVQQAQARLDAHVREIVEWHFNPQAGCTFWLEYAANLNWDPRAETRCFAGLRKFPPFQDEWQRGGPVRRWVPQG